MSKPKKYITTELFLEVCIAAKVEKRNRYFEVTNIKEQFLTGEKFVVAQHFMFEPGSIRAGILIDDQIYYVDMSLTRYESLPNLYEGSTGLFIEPIDVAQQRRPNGSPRTWSEKPVIKHKRKWDFAKQVKSAYQNQCAICATNTPSLLIGAHIKPVAEGGDDEISNGICLCRNHDILYENGHILINQFGDIICNGVKEGQIFIPKHKEHMPLPTNLLYRVERSKRKISI